MAREWDDIDCPKCKNTIKAKARLCPHCGAEFTREAAKARAKAHYKDTATGCLTLVALAGLILWGVNSCSRGDEAETQSVAKVETAPTTILDSIHLRGGKAEAKASGFTDCSEGFTPTCRLARPEEFLGVRIKGAYVSMDGPDYRYNGIKVAFDDNDFERLKSEVMGWLDDPSDGIIEVKLNRITRYHPKLPIKLQSYPTGLEDLEFKIIPKGEWEAVKARIVEAEKFRDEMSAP